NSLGGQDLVDSTPAITRPRWGMIRQNAVLGEKNLLVIATDQAAENVTGFFTKWGDGAADLLPWEGLKNRQGAQMLQHLQAPEDTWRKVPTEIGRAHV